MTPPEGGPDGEKNDAEGRIPGAVELPPLLGVRRVRARDTAEVGARIDHSRSEGKVARRGNSVKIDGGRVAGRVRRVD